MHSFFNNATIDWAQGIHEVDLVYTINDSGSGHISNFPELKDLTTPTRVRIAMVQVSAGSRYDPTQLPAGDGGVAEGGTKDGGSVDAAGASDAGRDAGSVGAGGGSGAAGAAGEAGAGGPTT